MRFAHFHSMLTWRKGTVRKNCSRRRSACMDRKLCLLLLQITRRCFIFDLLQKKSGSCMVHRSNGMLAYISNSLCASIPFRIGMESPIQQIGHSCLAIRRPRCVMVAADLPGWITSIICAAPGTGALSSAIRNSDSNKPHPGFRIELRTALGGL